MNVGGGADLGHATFVGGAFCLVVVGLAQAAKTGGVVVLFRFVAAIFYS